jgi:hypothetical protein
MPDGGAGVCSPKRALTPMKADAGAARLGTGAVRPDGIRNALVGDRIALIPVVASAFSRRRTNRWTHAAWWVVYAFGAAVDMIIKSALCDSRRRAVVCWAPAHNRRETVAGIVIGMAIAGAGIAMVAATGAGHTLATLSWPEVFALVAALIGAFAFTARGWRRRAPLTALRPRGAWMISSVSSVSPGVGGAVLDALCRWADRSGQLLCVDAVVGPLTERYYPRLGFTPEGEPVDVGRGRRRQVMVRQPLGVSSRP